jgi:hypothetical protein
MPSTLFLRRSSALRSWRQLHPGFARFRQANGNGLFGILDAVLPFPHMMDLFADEFSRLRCWRLAFASILAGAFDSLFLWHSILLR